MESAHPALAHDWLAACRAAGEGLKEVMRQHPTTGDRLVETGETGGGGDRTLVIDQLAEDHVFSELERLHDAGARFTAVSEERGRVDFGDDGVLVVVDPIDGSMNAKRGLTHHALSIAVADGPTMADVAFAYVLDLGPEEEWTARRGAGAFLDGVRLHPPPERRNEEGKLELVAVESADPRWLARSSEGLQQATHRLRAIGAMAISLSQVAATRVDGMCSLWRCRAVDVAAAQLVVRESGGCVQFVGAPSALDAPLDLEPHFPVVGARTPEALEQLAAVVA
ncbi:inositol monophosphatase family protein [Conexibacter sp. SYSU D00693]|uniref:inositol monophosphatase family protein n=1 Tax=Conexibacter sp. SYSU D00693 TaxID=2812560 RepID=UPI00196BAB3D|nr:inositol monophosphatase family protein [Conexibacter sp. SYSU D00693]